MLKKLLISSCITGVLSLYIVQNTDSPMTPDSSSDRPMTAGLDAVSPKMLPGLADLSATAQSVQLTSLASKPEPAPQIPVPVVSIPPFTIRVLVASGFTDLTVAAETDAVVLDSDGAEIAILPPAVSYTAKPNEAGIQIGDLQFPTLVQIASTEDGTVYLNGHWYRGMLTLVNIGSELLAINSLDLEEYLYSVVGAEMPATWNSEALKSQAIAARSYALAHIENPISAWYDLGDDEVYQVYKGVETEAPSTYAAVVDTDGQVLAQDGRTLTALYASTDAVSNEAHSGIGMSQVGAQEMASFGAGYEEILARYYSSGEIYRLDYI